MICHGETSVAKYSDGLNADSPQICSREVRDCRSFNYLASTETCEINFCSRADGQKGVLADVTIHNDSNSQYYELTVRRNYRHTYITYLRLTAFHQMFSNLNFQLC